MRNATRHSLDANDVSYREFDSFELSTTDGQLKIVCTGCTVMLYQTAFSFIVPTTVHHCKDANEAEDWALDALMSWERQVEGQAS